MTSGFKRGERVRRIMEGSKGGTEEALRNRVGIEGWQGWGGATGNGDL